MGLSLLFTRFATALLRDKRYVITRYELNNLAIKAGATNHYSYCFSHSKKFSAMILSAEQERVSIDIEPVERQLGKALEIRIRQFDPRLAFSGLWVLMILECLIKIQPEAVSFSQVLGLYEDGPAEIVALGQETFEVTFRGAKVYSKIYRFGSFFVCTTREKNQFPLNL